MVALTFPHYYTVVQTLQTLVLHSSTTETAKDKQTSYVNQHARATQSLCNSREQGARPQHQQVRVIRKSQCAFSSKKNAGLLTETHLDRDANTTPRLLALRINTGSVAVSIPGGDNVPSEARPLQVTGAQLGHTQDPARTA